MSEDNTTETTEETSDALPKETDTLMQRCTWVRDRVTRLGKDAEVGTGRYTYKAITHDKVTAFIRPKMVQAGIMSFITCLKAKDIATGTVTDKGRTIVQHRAKYRVTFVNVYDKTDKIEIDLYAYADDVGDKAPGKATSYAMKYAMLKFFMIETGEDDEERAEPKDARGATLGDDENLLMELFAVAEELYGDDAASKLKAMSERRFHVDSYDLIPQTRFQDAVRSLKSNAAALEKQKETDGEK